MPTLGEQLKEQRLRDNLSLRAAAHIVGVAFSTLARIERGEVGCTPDVEQRILRWINTGAATPARERRSRPWILSIEQRLSRIEARLGLEADECPK